MNQKYLEMERTYHTQLEQKNNDLRAFRHDFNSHMLTLQALAQEEKWTQVRNYLSRMSDVRLKNYYISTGNLIADTLINRFYNMLGTDVLFKTSGYFQSDCFIDDFDICTIFSNMLNNTLEALSMLDTSYPKEVYLDIDDNKNRISILMKNSSISYEESELDNIHTIKPDKKNHGFGLSNIRETAGKYHGLVKTNCHDNMFICYIVFLL